MAVLDFAWLAKPYALWWAGQAITGDELSIMGVPSWPPHYWARLGKVLQFLAGTVAIVDLLKLDAIRRREQSARRRLTSVRRELTNFNKSHDLFDLSRQLFDDIVEIHPSPFGPPPDYVLRPKSSIDADLFTRFTQDEYLDFRSGVFSELKTRRGQPDEWPGAFPLHPREVAYVNGQIAEFIELHLNDDDLQLRSVAQQGRDRLFLIASAGWIPLILVVLILSLASVDVTETRWVVGPYIAILAFWLVAVSPVGRSLLSLRLQLKLTAAITTFRLIRIVLENTRNPRVLRMLALTLFIVGFQLDLLTA